MTVFHVRIRCPECRTWIEVDNTIPEEDYQEVPVSE